MSERFEDKIYGCETVDEPLLVALLRTPAVERLRGLYMGGITGLLGVGPMATRYEHSIGAMLLVRRLGGSVEEQAAALLHDISHTALSHVVDYVLDTPSRQAFHDDVKEEYLSETDIPAICNRHGTDWLALADERRWSLLEQDRPRLCADRVDYTWRDVEALGVMTASEASALTSELVVQDGRMAFRDKHSARAFADAYQACDRLCWSSPRSVGLYMLSAQALRAALEHGVIDRGDLWLTDKELWRRLTGAPNDEVQRLACRVSADTSISFSSCGDLRLVPKLRFVDPDVIAAGGILPLSSIDANWRSTLDSYVATKEGEWRLEAEPAS